MPALPPRPPADQAQSTARSACTASRPEMPFRSRLVEVAPRLATLAQLFGGQSRPWRPAERWGVGAGVEGPQQRHRTAADVFEGVATLLHQQRRQAQCH